MARSAASRAAGDAAVRAHAGLPNAQSLKAIAERLDVSVDWLLFGGSDEPVSLSGRERVDLADAVDSAANDAISQGRTSDLGFRVRGVLAWALAEVSARADREEAYYWWRHGDPRGVPPLLRGDGEPEPGRYHLSFVLPHRAPRRRCREDVDIEP